jgi:hypothetical protein
MLRGVDEDIVVPDGCKYATGQQQAPGCDLFQRVSMKSSIESYFQRESVWPDCYASIVFIGSAVFLIVRNYGLQTL